MPIKKFVRRYKPKEIPSFRRSSKKKSHTFTDKNDIVQKGKIFMLSEKFNQLKAISQSIHYEAKDIKALFSYDRIDMLEPNKNRLKADIDCAISGLEELKAILIQEGLYQ